MVMSSVYLHQLSPSPCPLKLSQPFILRPQFHLPPLSKPLNPISCSYTTTPATDRLISAASYSFPFLNGVQYGRLLTILTAPLQTKLPLLPLYSSDPYATSISFFAVYLGIVQNHSFNRYVRFNALQALLLQILLVLIEKFLAPLLLFPWLQYIFSSPELIFRSLIQGIFFPGRVGLGDKLMIWIYNGLFTLVVGCFFYGVVSSLLGKTPYFPFIAEASGSHLD